MSAKCMMLVKHAMDGFVSKDAGVNKCVVLGLVTHVYDNGVETEAMPNGHAELWIKDPSVVGLFTQGKQLRVTFEEA